MSKKSPLPVKPLYGGGRFFYLLAGGLLLLALDLGSKYLATQSLDFHLNYAQRQMQGKPGTAKSRGREILPLLGQGGRYLRLRLVFNDKGMMGGGEKQSQGSLLFGLAWIFFLFVVGYWFFGPARLWASSLMSREIFLPYSWMLLLSGSLGNWIDRLFLKSLSDRTWVLGLSPRKGCFVQGVTDFIDVLWYGNAFSTWPVLRSFSFERWPVFNLADVFLFLGILLFLMDLLNLSSKIFRACNRG